MRFCDSLLSHINLIDKNITWRVVGERIRGQESSSGVSDQQSVGSSSGRVFKQDT